MSKKKRRKNNVEVNFAEKKMSKKNRRNKNVETVLIEKENVDHIKMSKQLYADLDKFLLNTIEKQR